MKVYISGPMTGYPDYNRPAFHERAEKIRALGHIPLNPASLDLGPGATWKQYMREDIKMLMGADAIDRLGGWNVSPGATFENMVAETVGIPVFVED